MNIPLARVVTAGLFVLLILSSLAVSLFQQQSREIALFQKTARSLAKSLDEVKWEVGKERFNTASSSYEYEEFKGNSFVQRSRFGDGPENIQVIIPDVRVVGFAMASSSGAHTIFPGYYVEQDCNQYSECTYGSIIYRLDRTLSPMRFIPLKNARYQESYYYGLAGEGWNGDWLLVCEEPDRDGEVRQLSFLNLKEDRLTKLKRLPQHLSYTREKWNGKPSPDSCLSGILAAHKMGDGAEVEIFRAEDFPLPHTYTYTRTPIAKITAFIDRVEESKDLIAY